MLDEKNTRAIPFSWENFVRKVLIPRWMEVLTGILVGISIVHLTIK